MRSTTTYGSLLDTNVPDDKFLNIQVLSIGIRLGVLQQTGDELDGLFGPAT